MKAREDGCEVAKELLERFDHVFDVLKIGARKLCRGRFM